MTIGHNDSSFDIQLGRDISKRLRGTQGSSTVRSRQKQAANATPAYATFKRENQTTATSPDFRSSPLDAPKHPITEQPTSIPPLVLDDSAGFGPNTWNNVLDYAMEAVHAEAAFMVDARGLIIANRGVLLQAEAEMMGARLLLAAEQAEFIQGMADDRPSPCISLTYFERILTAFRLRISEGEPIIFGILSNQPVPRQLQTRIEFALGNVKEVGGGRQS